MRERGRGAHGGEPAGAAYTVEERAVSFRRETKFVGDEEVKARVSGVGACYGDCVSDVARLELSVAECFFAGLHRKIDARFAEDAVELADGWSNGA